MPRELFSSKRRFRISASTPLASLGPAWLVAAGTFACGTTPLDSVILEEVVSNAGSGGSAAGGSGAVAGTGAIGAEGGSASGGTGGAEAGSAGASGGGGDGGAPECTVPAPGRYQVRDRVGDRCLQKGEVDPVLHAPVYSALLDGDCSVPEAQWEFREIIAGGYALYNIGSDANLDVRAGSTVAGTPIVLYTPLPLDNQLFWFLPRTPPYFALEAQNAPGKCVEAVGAGARLYPCDDTNQAQDFNLVRVDCP